MKLLEIQSSPRGESSDSISRIEVVIAPFVKVPQWARRGAELEAERLANFFGSTLQLKWKK